MLWPGTAGTSRPPLSFPPLTVSPPPAPLPPQPGSAFSAASPIMPLFVVKGLTGTTALRAPDPASLSPPCPWEWRHSAPAYHSAPDTLAYSRPESLPELPRCLFLAWPTLNPWSSAQLPGRCFPGEVSEAERQPTPVFLPGESQGWGSLVGCRLWGRTESDTTEAT